MNWKKRKKQNKILKHYGFNTYAQYKKYLRFKYEVQHYRENHWFSDSDKILIAYHIYPFL